MITPILASTVKYLSRPLQKSVPVEDKINDPSLTPEQRLEATEPLVLDLAANISAYLAIEAATANSPQEEGQVFSLLNLIGQGKAELNELIIEGWDPNNPEALSPAEQANLVGLLMGIYLNSEDPATRFSAFSGLKYLILNEADQNLDISLPLKIKIISFLIDMMGRDPDAWLRQSAVIALGDLLLRTDLLDWQIDQIISAFLATAENKEEDPRVRQVEVSLLHDCLYQGITTETCRKIIDLFICISQDGSEPALVRSEAATSLVFLDEERVPLEVNLLAADALCEMSFNNELPDNGYWLEYQSNPSSIRRENNDQLIGDLLNSDRIRPEVKDRIEKNMIEFFQ
jgi:hypothetical protein